MSEPFDTEVRRSILHVDVNAYFATILQQENPALRGRPLGITKEAGRTCIIAASKEAKLAGVKTGSRLSEARQLCPNLLTLPASFDRYLDATKKLQAVFSQFSPNVYMYSLDEAFIDLTHCLKYSSATPHQVAQHIQSAIKKDLGEWVTANVGIGPNRFLAKMTSEISPKGSISQVTSNNLTGLLATTPFEDVCGVGVRLAKKLAKIGVTRLYHLQFMTHEELTPLVGPFWATQLLRMSQGQEPHLLQQLDTPATQMKSVGRSITGFQLHNNEASIKAVIRNLLDEVTYKVRRMDMAGRYVWLKLYGSAPNQHWSTHRTLQYYVRHTSEIFNLLYTQGYCHWQRSFPVIKFAVRLGQLQPTNQISQSLLPSWHKQEKISAAMDTISQKYGLFTVRSGLLTNRDIIRPEVTGFLGDRIYQLGS